MTNTRRASGHGMGRASDGAGSREASEGAMAWIALALLTASALAGPIAPEPGAPKGLGRIAVVAIGRCEEPRLGQAARALRAELRLQQGADVLSEEETASPAGGLPRATLEESNKTIDAARNQFFSLDYGTAEATLRKIMLEIDRLPPGSERWEAAARARIELAHVSVFNLKRDLSARMLYDVLRLQEDLELDRHRYPPLLRDELEKARRLVRRARRFTLRVQSASSYPVFLNGREVGKTPFERGLVEGEYEVVVGDPTAHSFPRRVELRADRDEQMEVLPEARFRAMDGPCFDADPTLEERAVAARLLAGALSVEHAVLVRLEKSGGEELVIATLVPAAGGPEVREGRQRAESAVVPRLRNLASYVLTGDASVLEERGPEGRSLDSPREQVAAPKKRARRVREPPAPMELAPTSPTAPPLLETPKAGFPWLRAGSIAMAVAAAGLGVVAIVEDGQASKARGDVVRMLSARGTKMTRALSEDVVARIREFALAKGLRNGFAIGAATAAATSGGLLLFSVVPRGDNGVGASVTVAGRF
jgi:hypothetical protein